MVQKASLWHVLTRRKEYGTESKDGDTKLKRALSLWDLTALGIGSTLGAGVYVLAGQIAKDQAGPSVMISFAIAAVASLLAGMCYAEFGARVPKAGSAYIYSYVCIGEFVAFVIGWNLILEYIIGTASVCRGISLYLDTMIDDYFKNNFRRIFPMDFTFVADYFDFFAFGLVIIFGAALSFGVETSAVANNFCTVLNLSVLLFVIIAGAIKANVGNWKIDPEIVNEDPSKVGSGGYFPFGVAGTLKGAATCFYGFVGFDIIATSGEEVRKPRKNIPRSIMLTLFVVFLCYLGVSTVLTLMVPYYQQDPNAPLPYAFKQVGWNFAMWIVAVGGLVGLLASLVGALFPVPRIMYSMAQDGLLFKFLGKVSPRFQVPVVGSICAALLTAFIAGFFDLAQLVNMLSIGTLLAYTVVAISVTLLRFMDSNHNTSIENLQENSSENTFLTSAGARITISGIMKQLCNCNRLKKPTRLSTVVVGVLLFLFCILSICIGLIFLEAFDALLSNQLWVLILLGVLVLLMCFILIAISLQPRETYKELFRVPFVPIVPGLSIFINIYLMIQLDVMTWIRFGIWMAIGVPIYLICRCLYGMNGSHHNVERINFAQALHGEIVKVSNSSEDPIKTKVSQLKTNSTSDTNDTNTFNNLNGNLHLPNHLGTNELSVKSMDEIQNLSDISEELVEMKQNGKTFFVTDSRSGSSSDSENGDIKSKNSKNTVSSEDETTVMEIFDSIFQGEDDKFTQNTKLGRKTSIDSELLPSVIETTTVATVHSSTSSSYENDLQKLSQSDNESSNHLDLNAHLLRKLEYRVTAKQLLDELFDSEEFWLKYEDRKQVSKVKSFEDESRIVPVPRVRSASISSLKSISSIQDPLHSDTFKNKLSRLILQPPPVTYQNKSNERQVKAADRNHHGLKHSKSEPDFQKLVLKVLEDSNLTNEDLDGSKTATGIVPRPPKFDPILYKTINSLGVKKSRPSLEPMMTPNKEPKFVQKIPLTQDPPEELSQESFKLKLESILKRGPSHKSQQRPDVPIKRPKSFNTHSTNDISNQFDDIVAKRATLNAELKVQSEVLENGKNSLRPAGKTKIET